MKKILEIKIENKKKLKLFVTLVYILIKLLDCKFLFLEGGLGTGKTLFTNILVKKFNLNSRVYSPSFSILNIYKNKEKNFIINHLDLFFLKNEEDLLYFMDNIFLDNSLNIIEWSDKTTFFNNKKHIKLEFEFIDDKKLEKQILIKLFI